MVSIRRRRHLGLCPATHSYMAQFTKVNKKLDSEEQSTDNAGSLAGQSVIESDVDQQKQKHVREASLGSSNVSGCSSSKEEHKGCEMKRRKRQRRKQFDNQEPCVMRGVYFKNMKWQAAIKVDKKQIHLGTVGTQEEAAHLYDRAAFLCGREPNFELSEEEKQDLRRFSWEQFLELTRKAIVNKKRQKKIEAGMRKKQLTSVHAVITQTGDGRPISVQGASWC